MRRGKPVDKITQLLQSGLARDQSKIAYYRQVMQDPSSGFTNQIYRHYATDVFNTMLSYMLNDPILYNRFRQNLLQDNPRLHYEEIEKEPNTTKVIKELLI